MDIAVFGTGMVGQAHAGRLAGLGYGVTVGTRNVEATLARTDPNRMGNPPFSEWLKNHPNVKLASYQDAAASAELIINATNGAGTLEAFKLAGEMNVAGKTVMDGANPLDFSGGMPPSLFVSNDDSLAERLQRSVPKARVVKTLNTVTADVMVNPKVLAGGDHTVFLSGDDDAAKSQVSEILRAYGWTDLLDLGGVATARGPEMYFALWIRAFQQLGSAQFNVKVVR